MNWVGLFPSVFSRLPLKIALQDEGGEVGRGGSSMGQRCFTYGLDTARGQGQVESCSLANVRTVTVDINKRMLWYPLVLDHPARTLHGYVSHEEGEKVAGAEGCICSFSPSSY